MVCRLINAEIGPKIETDPVGSPIKSEGAPVKRGRKWILRSDVLFGATDS
jgi:hypothetical protein